MATYNVKALVEYQWEVEADSQEEAEALAFEYEYWNDDTAYYGMYSCEVEEDIR
jgi:hypothetical protein